MINDLEEKKAMYEQHRNTNPYLNKFFEVKKDKKKKVANKRVEQITNPVLIAQLKKREEDAAKKK